MRGYRKQAGEAPLRETLAAAILRMSGWDRNSPLIDPMCGSGTIAIEAAMWSANMAPGLMRKQFGFERWADFESKDAETLNGLRGEMRASVRDNVRIVASDNGGSQARVRVFPRNDSGFSRFAERAGASWVDAECPLSGPAPASCTHSRSGERISRYRNRDRLGETTIPHSAGIKTGRGRDLLPGGRSRRDFD